MTVDVRGYARAVGLTAGDKLSRGDRSVFAWLNVFVNAVTAETWVNSKTLATVVGMDQRWIRHHLGRLVATGYVIAEPRPGRSTLYRLPAAPVEVVHTPDADVRGSGEQPRTRASGGADAGVRGGRTRASYVNSQGTVKETLPPIHVANGFAAAADDTGEFELAPEIYARIGHHMPKARPKGSA